MRGGIYCDCMTISHGIVILTSGLVAKDYPEICMMSMRKHQTAPVTIGDGVWLCMVMPGVRIANKIIVAAGSVVTKDCDNEGWLYGGVPAKPIKPLYKINS